MARAGTTSLILQAVLGRSAVATPTLRAESWEVELEHRSGVSSQQHFTLWDVPAFITGQLVGGAKGGHASSVAACAIAERTLRRASGVVLVVDSTQSVSSAAELLRWALNLTQADIPLFIAANKQDLPGASTPAQVVIELGLRSSSTLDHHSAVSAAAAFSTWNIPSVWTCQPCVASSDRLDAHAVLAFFASGAVRPLLLHSQPRNSAKLLIKEKVSADGLQATALADVGFVVGSPTLMHSPCNCSGSDSSGSEWDMDSELSTGVHRREERDAWSKSTNFGVKSRRRSVQLGPRRPGAGSAGGDADHTAEDIEPILGFRRGSHKFT